MTENLEHILDFAIENYAYLIFMAGGLILVILFIVHIRETIRMRSWATVEGQIVNISIETAKSDNEAGYEKAITYKFEANGKTYTSDQVHKGPVETDQFAYNALKRNTEYKLFKKVKVYYDPQNPSDSVLEIEIQANAVFLFIVGVILIVTMFNQMLT